MRELTGDAEEDARCEASGVKERDHRTTPPVLRVILDEGLLASRE